MPTTRTTLTLTAVGLLALAVVAVLALGAAPTGADVEPTPPPDPAPIAAEPLTQRHTFTDDVAVQVRDKPAGRRTDVVNLRDASNLAVVEITIQPGATFPWHTHPGPVLAAVAEGDDEGAFVYVYADDCVERPYGVGEAFVDPGDSVHTAYNPSETEETVVIATFLDAPDDVEAPLTVPVDEDLNEALDEECGIDR